ncbi:hypothetical protein HMPREF9570_01481 [Cutibacterium acnes HL043PA1]|nr:hypothetical protein HMPREF9570_01481 [Cutibacterium acnes HL043PA1]
MGPRVVVDFRERRSDGRAQPRQAAIRALVTATSGNTAPTTATVTRTTRSASATSRFYEVSCVDSIPCGSSYREQPVPRSSSRAGRSGH